MVIVGHGLVARQLRGPLAPSAAPEQRLVLLRRYRCRACHAVLLVGPSGLSPRRWYARSAIAAALAGYGRGDSSADVRARVSPAPVVGVAAADRWVTVSRWIDAAQRGDLFAVRGLAEHSRRAVAQRVTEVLAARGGHRFGEDLAASAFAGAVFAP